MKTPKVGDEIYIRTSLSIDHGWDDICGGLAKVVRVTSGISAGRPTPFVEVYESPGRSYNWEILAEEQEKLAEQYGTKRAHPDPDFPDQWSFRDRMDWLEDNYGEAFAFAYAVEQGKKLVGYHE